MDYKDRLEEVRHQLGAEPWESITDAINRLKAQVVEAEAVAALSGNGGPEILICNKDGGALRVADDAELGELVRKMPMGSRLVRRNAWWTEFDGGGHARQADTPEEAIRHHLEVVKELAERAE